MPTAIKMKKKKQEKKIEGNIVLPEGILASVENNIINVKGPKGEIKKNMADKDINISVKDNKINLAAGKKSSKREKMRLGSFKSHIKNMIRGVSEGYVYKLKICSGHFPMSVSISGNEFIIQNFLGEKIPRKFRVKEGAKIKIEGDEITVEGIDKDIVAQTAGRIEQSTRITNRDRRVFQDGIYIIHKTGKHVK